jgi:hypothetical protein
MPNPVKYTIVGLTSFVRSVQDQLNGLSKGDVDKLMTQIAARYLGFIRKRFVKYSRGGGDWKPLKRKRKRGALDEVAILRDTGTLFNALTIDMPGNLTKRIKGGVRVGFGGPDPHPNGPFTIAQIAEVHNEGRSGDRPPKRQIIVEPEAEIHNAIQKDLHKLMGKEMEKAENRVL